MPTIGGMDEQEKADATLNEAVASWQSGVSTPEFEEAVSEWAGSLAAYCRTRHPHLAQQDDLREEAALWVLEQMSQWRVDEGHVRGFVSSRFKWFASAQTRGGGELPGKSWFRVYAVASRIRGEALAHSQQLSMAELAERSRAALEESLEASIRTSNPELSDAAVRADVLHRMGKDGYSAALDHLGEVLAAGASPMRLDQPVGSESEQVTLGATLAGDPDVHDPQDDPEARLDALQAVMLGDNDWARQALAVRAGCDVEGQAEAGTYQALAEASNHSAAELKAVLKLAKARVRAGHAQWAHLTDATLIAVAEPTALFADS